MKKAKINCHIDSTSKNISGDFYVRHEKIRAYTQFFGMSYLRQKLVSAIKVSIIQFVSNHKVL